MKKESNSEQVLTPDIEKALELINKRFYLLENNTALEHDLWWVPVFESTGEARLSQPFHM